MLKNIYYASLKSFKNLFLQPSAMYISFFSFIKLLLLPQMQIEWRQETEGYF